MVTLLLTFFVMLLSLATVQDPEIYSQGRDSFVESIELFGLGVLYGREPKPVLNEVKVKYFIENPEKSLEKRTIAAREEQVRRIFEKLVKDMKAAPPQIVGKGTSFSVTDIYFSRGKAALNDSAKEFLKQFLVDLQQSAGARGMKLYVLGLARDVKKEKKQWILSAKRAKVVADFLQSELHTDSEAFGGFGPLSGLPIYSWGAGPGGDWVGEGSPATAQSHILIAVLTGDD
jgi:outer membrane protein OmpA-like peptidoglycan-associated protein